MLSVLKGDLSVGDVLKIEQLGGQSDGTAFVAEGESSLGRLSLASHKPDGYRDTQLGQWCQR